jgi:AcrR family transcriptional regulator
MNKSSGSPDPRTVRSKLAMREALLRLMAAKSFASISITEILRQTGYNRSTFYANYGTKQDLLEDMMSVQIRELVQAFRAPYRNVSEFFPNELQTQSVLIFDHIVSHAEFYSVFAKSDLVPLLWQRMLTSLKQTLTEELVYEPSDINHELALIYYLHALLGLIFHWIETGFVHSSAYMQEQLVKIITYHSDKAKKGIKTRTSPPLTQSAP